ncbi:MAG: bifunctional 3'-5' exonuclease/DNA polymerase, partial [Clostridia bacterium]|nr:bifunctional 3'-5' exonuclease/DNA polymerase [Clostridia bacterium]
QAELRKAQLSEIADIEFSCVFAIADIELTGIKIDKDRLSSYSAEIEKQVLTYQDKLNSFVKNAVVQQTFFGPPETQTINFNSMKQVLDFLNENGIMVTDTSQYSLSKYSTHPIVIALKEYRKAYKLYSGFLDSLPEHIKKETSRIHASYSQIGAYSGRMSCRNPNMQQIPRDNQVRDLFTPEKGYQFIIADYSQVELRVAADIAKDDRMIKAYKENLDLHKLTASLITDTPVDSVTKEQRQAAKAVNFGLIFGMGSKGLQDYAHDTYNIDITLDQADQFKNQYFKAYTGIKKWHDSLKANPPDSARSLTGRRYFYNSQTGFSSYCNTPVQGSAADILKNALGHLYQVIKGTDTHIIAVIHDEIILECKEEKCEKMKILLKNIMENSSKDFLLSVPMVADVVIARSWAEK